MKTTTKNDVTSTNSCHHRPLKFVISSTFVWICLDMAPSHECANNKKIRSKIQNHLLFVTYVFLKVA